MVKEIYICGICNARYKTYAKAQRCEDQGKLRRLKRGTVFLQEPGIPADQIFYIPICSTSRIIPKEHHVKAYAHVLDAYRYIRKGKIIIDRGGKTLCDLVTHKQLKNVRKLTRREIEAVENRAQRGVFSQATSGGIYRLIPR